MDNDPIVAGFGVQAVLLAEIGVTKARADQGNGQKTSEVHAGECSDQATQNEATSQGADSPVNELPLETTVDKGLLKPLID